MWFNTGRPNGSLSGDYEDTALILAQNPRTMCSTPNGIHAQSLSYRTGNWVYGWRWAQVTNIVAFVSFYLKEPDDVDFRVRYCCPTHAIIGTTPETTSRPVPLDNLTCGKRVSYPSLNLGYRLFGWQRTVSHAWPFVSTDRQSLSFSVA